MTRILYFFFAEENERWKRKRKESQKQLYSKKFDYREYLFIMVLLSILHGQQ